jgi:hypothetical protein
VILARAGADLNVCDSQQFPYIADIINLLAVRYPLQHAEYFMRADGTQTAEVFRIPPQQCPWKIQNGCVFWRGEGLTTDGVAGDGSSGKSSSCPNIPPD